MSFAHFNEINEICKGMLKKEPVGRKKLKKKKRYIIHTRPYTQEQVFKDGEEENETENESEKLYLSYDM